MSKIAIIGATGRAGSQLLEEALRRGHSVVAIARNTDPLAVRPGVTVKQVDALDADALQPELAGHGHTACIWTPHPGEAARLLGTRTQDVTRDPLSAARALQQRLSGVVVLKGGPSVVAYPGGLSVSRGGHPGMASGGMGDTLSGILAALLGQGLSARDAAVTGVRLHARAGERAAQVHGYGLSASDVAQELGGAWQDLSAALPAHRPG